MDGGAWRATFHGVTESDTTEQLTHTHTHTHRHLFLYLMLPTIFGSRTKIYEKKILSITV